jgi:hypothetical protein
MPRAQAAGLNAARRPRRATAAALALALAAMPGLAGCASTPDSIAPLSPAPAPRFDALRFFEGRAVGRGELSKVFAGTVPVTVYSEGQVEPDGSLTLVQRIEEGDKPVRLRTWSIREVARVPAPGGGTIRYEGTLTDASGPVEGSSEGNRLTLTYPIEGGFRVEQVLTLSEDGERAYNRLEVSLAGVTVAVLAEEIVRGEQ